MKLRMLSGVAIALTAVPLIGLPNAQPAGALAPTAAAYWVKLGTAVPTVPAGGLFVGNDPSSVVQPNQPPNLPVAPPAGVPVPVPNVPPLPGPKVTGATGISAVRISGINPTADVTLTLTVFPLSLPPASPSVSTIVACPIVATWSPPPGGAGDISNAPAANCSTPSVGRVAGDFMSVSWLLPASFQGTPGELDVELLPGASDQPAPFSVTFNPPTVASIKAAAGGAIPPAPPAAPAPVPAATPTAATPVESSGAVLTPPAPPYAPTSHPIPATTRLRTTRGGALSRLAGISVPGVTDDRGHRIMAVAILLAIAAALWYLGGREERGPRRVGSRAAGLSTVPVAATVGEGGIGRFRRDRDGRPPRL